MDSAVEAAMDDGAVASDGPTFDTPASLDAVPIRLAGMAFNESKNSGFDKTIEISGHASDFSVTKAGRVKSTVAVKAGGPALDATELRDALFVKVSATYVLQGFGDTFSKTAAPPTGFLATSSTETDATFAVDLGFEAPIALESDGSPLVEVTIDFTWVRGFRKSGTRMFHVLPGGGSSPSDLAAKWDTSLSFDHAFGYYQPILASAVAPEFDYPGWFSAHAPF